jgi:hypothetical protein
VPATRNTQTGTSGPPSAAGSPGGQRHLGRGRRLRSGTAPHSPPDLGALARAAVINFLQDASEATAERAAVRAGTAATGAGATAAAGNTEIAAAAPEPAAMPGDAISGASDAAADSVAWRTALERIEAAAAKVEEDIAVAHRAYVELQAGAGAAAEAAVRAAESAMASAGTAVEAERRVKISLRQVRQNVVITMVLVIIVLIVLALASSNVH